MSIQTVALPDSLAAKPRTQPEGHVKYSEDNCVNLGRLRVTAAGVCTWTPSGEEIPSGYAYMQLFAVAVYPIGALSNQLTLSGNRGGSGLIEGYTIVAANVTYDSAFLFSGGEGWESVTNVTCSSGTADDLIDIFAVPDPDQFTDLRYVRTFEWNQGDHMIPVPDRFEPARTVIRVRRAPEFSIGKDYVDFTSLDSLRGREVTILIELHPSGLAGVQEYIFFPNAGISVNANAPDNAMISSMATGPSKPLIIYQPGA